MKRPSLRFGGASGLTGQFLAAACTTIAVSMGVLAYSISERTEASMMHTAAEEGALMIEVFLGPSVQELATSRNLSAESVKRLDDLLLGKLGERVRLIKIWLPDATLVYSTNKKAVGARFPSPQITAAFEGKVSGEFDYLDDLDNATQRNLHVPLVELYAPLFRTGTQEIIAVGEVYNDGRRLAADLTSIRLTTIGIVGAISALMVLLLFLMVRRAAALIRRHQESLTQKIVEAEALAAQNDQLRRAADEARLDAARSNETLLEQIGQDLHDGPIQLLSLLMLKLTEDAMVAGNQPMKDAHTGPNVQELTTRILTELRHISKGLVLPQLEGLTAAETLWLAVRQHEYVTGTEVACQIGDLPDDPSQAMRICLYRVVQEGLNNSFSHAGAQGQRVTASADASWIVVVVSDSGNGLASNDRAPLQSRPGLGLAGLRRRIEAIHGSFELSFQLGRGTQIHAKLPIKQSGG